MKQWVTEIKAIRPQDGELIVYCGPEVPGETHEDAKAYCQENGLGYCNVLGELIAEVPYELAEFASTLYGDLTKN